MRILFIHNNFPAQFGQLGMALAEAGWDVSFLTQKEGAEAPGIRTFVYKERKQPTDGAGPHPFLRGSQAAVVNGSSVLEVATALRGRGYVPDIVVAHTGWGGGLFVREVWPEAAFVAYCEWYYRGDAEDLALAKERPATPVERAKEHVRNTPILLDLVACDAAIVPTQYQAQQFPPEFRGKIHVLHDGIETAFFSPGEATPETFEGVSFEPGDEILTYATRGMEPYRGFPTFMRALALLQGRRPSLKTIVLGQDRVAYGAPLPAGESWKARMLAELELDRGRLAMPGLAPLRIYRNVLRLSSVHCYLTYPFVLSWSLLEAMSTGCTIVASDTAPVREVIEDGRQGVLTPLDDHEALAARLDDVLTRRAEFGHLGKAARETVQQRYRRSDHVAAKKVLFADLVQRRRA